MPADIQSYTAHYIADNNVEINGLTYKPGYTYTLNISLETARVLQAVGFEFEPPLPPDNSLPWYFQKLSSIEPNKF